MTALRISFLFLAVLCFTSIPAEGVREGRAYKSLLAVFTNFLRTMIASDPRSCILSMVCNVGTNVSAFGKVGARMQGYFDELPPREEAIMKWRPPADYEEADESPDNSYGKGRSFSDDLLLTLNFSMPIIGKNSSIIQYINKFVPVEPLNMTFLKPIFNMTRKQQLTALEVQTKNVSIQLGKKAVESENEVTPRFYLNELNAFNWAFNIGKEGGQPACDREFPLCHMTTQDLANVATMAFPPE